MITYSIIKKSQLEGALRLDAEYYQPEYLETINNLDRLKAVPIRDIAINPSRKFKPKKGEVFNYIEISEVDLSTGEYNKTEILGENAPDRAQWIVKRGDIIISTVRPIRNAVSLITEKTENLVCSSGFAVLKSEKVESEYLFAYLKSKKIVELLDRLTTATMYPAVTIEDILNTKIILGTPKFRQEIKGMVVKSQEELENSKKFWAEAESLLLEELGLKNFENKESLFSIVNLSDVKNARRMDAEYFQSKYEALISKIKNYKNGFDSIDNLIGISNEKIQVNPEKEYNYIELADVNESSGMVDNVQKIKGKELPSRARMKLQKNDIIVSSVEGSTDKVALINKDTQDLVGSTGFFVLREKYFEPEVNLILIKSLIIKSLLIREAQGTILTAIPSSSLKRIILPKLKKDIQQKIAELVKKSHEARKKAKELLEEAKAKAKAKAKVEQLIENNN